MQGYFAVATLIILVILVLLRVLLMKKAGIKAMKFGAIDKTDFFIIPFALLLFYIIFSGSLNLPQIGFTLFNSEIAGWIGVILCFLALMLIMYSLISFGKSFRVGIDEDKPGSLVTTGAFSFSRNPIYTAFSLILIGNFLIYSNWILLIILIVAFWLFNRQIIREEESLRKIYGEEYIKYCKKVRRYL